MKNVKFIMKLFVNSVMRYYRNKKLSKKFKSAIISHEALIDDDSRLDDYSVVFKNVSINASIIEKYSYIQESSIITNAEIGKFCSIGPRVVIGLGAHPINFISTSPVFYDLSQPLPRFMVKETMKFDAVPRTIVGSDVWIGDSAKIRAGVTIGHGAVIGAGALVVKDVRPYDIVGGVPAKVIRSRFSPEKVEALLAIKWWDFEEERLIDIAELFSQPDVFFAKLKD